MNAIRLLAAQRWVEGFGWTLIHFLWQGTVIAILYGAMRRSMAERATAHARYLLGCAALGLMLAAPLATWEVVRPSVGVPDAAYRVRAIPAAPARVAASLPEAVRGVVPGDLADRYLVWTVAAWLMGAGILWVRLAGGWVLATRMRKQRVRPAPAEWQQTLARLGARIGVSRPVRLLASGLVQVPTVVGWLRPVVLVPAGAFTGMAPDQLGMVLAHELAHIGRHDYLVNLVQSVAEALLFYHPAVWWVSRHIRAERELCCDDIAIAVSGGDALAYAQALVEWEAYRPARLTAAVAVNGGSLTVRIGRLLGEPRPPSRGGAAVLASAVLLLGAVYGMFGQTVEKPRFQAASIKPNTAATPRGRIVRPQPGGRLTSENAPLVMLIQNAYSVQAFQIVGGPPWINSAGYDIEAKPEGPADRPQVWLMLQSLLADRFKLELHRETRELPLFALTVAKGSFQPPPPKEGTCSAAEPDVLPPPGALTQCGRVRISLSPAGLRMDGDKVKMAELIRMLAGAMGRPVLDRTGFAGEFDVHLTFTPDQTTMGLPGAGGPRDSGGPQLATDPDRPTIFAALQEQLGLKLVTAKGPVEVLVIDHVERPTEN